VPAFDQDGGRPEDQECRHRLLSALACRWPPVASAHSASRRRNPGAPVVDEDELIEDWTLVGEGAGRGRREARAYAAGLRVTAESSTPAAAGFPAAAGSFPSRRSPTLPAK